MASKRRLRRKACEGKIRYKTMEDAQKVAKRLKLNSYRCPHCSGIHNGHTPFNVRQAQNAGRENAKLKPTNLVF